MLTPDSELLKEQNQQIGDQDTLLSIAWLNRGLELAKAVARIVTTEGNVLGTGFLIAPNLLMTNHHVIGSREEAKTAVVQFNYQLQLRANFGLVRRYRLNSDGIFITQPPEGEEAKDQDLDYTIVQVAGIPGWRYGYINLVDPNCEQEQACRASLEGFVNIIQHPGGAVKQIALTNNRVVAFGFPYVDYTAATSEKSSGSPVFNQGWSIVGLHRAGGELMGADGKLYRINRGTEIQYIIEDIKKKEGSLSNLIDRAKSGEWRRLLYVLSTNLPDRWFRWESVSIQELDKPERTLYNFLLDSSLQNFIITRSIDDLELDELRRRSEGFLEDRSHLKEILNKVSNFVPGTTISITIIPAIAAGVVCAYRRREEQLAGIKMSSFISSLPLKSIENFVEEVFLKQQDPQQEEFTKFFEQDYIVKKTRECKVIPQDIRKVDPQMDEIKVFEELSRQALTDSDVVKLIKKIEEIGNNNQIKIASPEAIILGFNLGMAAYKNVTSN